MPPLPPPPPPSNSPDDHHDKPRVEYTLDLQTQTVEGEDVFADLPCPYHSKPSKSFDAVRDTLQIPPFHHHARSPSPGTFSDLSLEEIRTGRSPSRGRPHRGISGSPAPPKTLKGKLHASWVRNKGLAWVLIAQLFGTLMNVTTRMLEIEGNNGKGMHPFQILFARMGITVALASAYMWWKKTEDFPFGQKGVRLLLVARGIGGFFGVFGMYYSLLYLPLADATVITFLAPSIACWACYYILKEPFTRMEQMAALISLFGVVLIARPTSFFSFGDGGSPPASGTGDAASSPAGLNGTTQAGGTEQTPSFDLDKVTPEERAAGVGVALLGVVGTAIAFTTIRWIGKRAHPLISVNYFSTMATVVSMLVMAFAPGVGFVFPANLREWSYLVFLGVCGFVMQFLLAAGLAYEKSSRATNMVYTQMLFALAFDKLFFDTTPGLLSIAGSSLILGSAIYVAVHKGKEREGREPARADEEAQEGLMSGQTVETESEGERGRSRSGVFEPGDQGQPFEEVQLRAVRN